jgi:hypothetical protein
MESSLAHVPEKHALDKIAVAPVFRQDMRNLKKPFQH